ncbi:ankyrin repeat and KH domain-containing protein 1-like [Formica exsecta]|uniref:ankyrin repeat and KH domain-containing protein 1-like n=1 Tax=Formica exsecta TaxID=72781 RepID=UPI0011449CB3|nr:ankyrin repeat and KH domain-containing protein 1-like [Formica exsecta]
MQNVVQGTTSDSQKSHEKQSAAAANVHYETGKTSNSSPTKSEIEMVLELQPRLMMESEEDSVSEVLLAMNANVEDRGDCTGLMKAASAGHVDIVSLLIAHGADVNAQSTTGNTPLMYGCAGGHEEVVRVLLEAGANVNDHNENGHTPLIIAAREGHIDLAMLLIENEANIEEVNDEAYTLLMKATREDDVKSAMHLIEREANIEDPF